VGCALLINDLYSVAFVGHHASTALLSWFVMGPFVHYYALFFIGVAEVSNMPLTVVDACKAFKPLRKIVPTLNTLSRLSFAVSFVVIRIVWWPIVSFGFWQLSLEALRTGSAKNSAVVGVFLVGNVFLTGLQFLWGAKLVDFALTTLGFEPIGGSKKGKTTKEATE
jgi:hypothetical protein